MKWFRWRKKKVKIAPVPMGSQTVTFCDPVTIGEAWKESDDVDAFINKITK